MVAGSDTNAGQEVVEGAPDEGVHGGSDVSDAVEGDERRGDEDGCVHPVDGRQEPLA